MAWMTGGEVVAADYGRVMEGKTYAENGSINDTSPVNVIDSSSYRVYIFHPLS